MEMRRSRSLWIGTLLGCWLRVTAADAAPRSPARPAQPGLSAPRRVSSPEDRKAIRAVLDRFMAAIAHKSGKELAALVLHSRILFTSPGDQAAVDAVRQYDPGFDGVGVGGFGAFARFITTTPDAIEERFHDVVITQDGPVAWVIFDYEFVANGKVQNYGVESWQLHKTDGAWKIFSVVWTQHAPSP